MEAEAEAILKSGSGSGSYCKKFVFKVDVEAMKNFGLNWTIDVS